MCFFLWRSISFDFRENRCSSRGKRCGMHLGTKWNAARVIVFSLFKDTEQLVRDWCLPFSKVWIHHWKTPTDFSRKSKVYIFHQSFIKVILGGGVDETPSLASLAAFNLVPIWFQSGSNLVPIWFQSVSFGNRNHSGV